MLSLLCCGAATSAFADAGVILNESLDTSVARITSSGHSAVYLSNICPDGSPVKMRFCRPGERGSVLSTYTTLGEDQPYEWNIVPLSIYLYGVEDPRDRPLVSSREIKAALEERYREKYLSQICTTARCRYSNSSEWREMVGATLERSLYIFVVKTSADQDRALLADFNSLPNVNHFNGAFRNCADFTKRVMNTYFPHSTHRDAVNDFFLTSPKAVARSFTHYAKENPDLDLRVLHFAQVPGTIKRSEECRSATEQLYHSKKLVIPLGVLAWQAVPAVTASYILTARFNPEHEFEKNPSANALGANNDFAAITTGNEIGTVTERQEAELKLSATNATAKDKLDPAPNGEPGDAASSYTVSVQQLAAENKSTRAAIVGTADDWRQFRANLNTAEDEALHMEIIPARGDLKRVFTKLADGSEISVDANGALWLSWRDDYSASQDASAGQGGSANATSGDPDTSAARSDATTLGAGAAEKFASTVEDEDAERNAASAASGAVNAGSAGASAKADDSNAGALTNADATRDTIVRVGLSASNISAPGSDVQAAYQIILARMESELRSPKHSRETAPEFREDWARLQQSRGQAAPFAGPAIDASPKTHPASASATGVVIAARNN